MTEKNYDRLPIIGDRPKNEKEEKHLRELVEYEFLNNEEPGLMQKFSYGDSKNRTTFIFMHGGKYRIPRHIARWMESRQIPQWDWKPNGRGSMEKSLKSYKPRFQMRPVHSF